MSEKGRTMLETLMVLAIIGVLTIISLFGYRLAIKKHMTNQAVKYVQVLAASSRSWLGVQMANVDRSNEGLDADIEDGLILGYPTEYGSLPFEQVLTSSDNFNLLPLDELMSGVRIKRTGTNGDRTYFEIFDNAKVSAMLTDRNDLVVNVEGMTVKECKELISSNIDSDEVVSRLSGNKYYRCSATTYSPDFSTLKSNDTLF